MLAAALMQQSAPADVAVDFIGQWGGPSYAVAADGTHAYVGVGPRLVVLDIADPAHPALLGRTGVLGGVVRDIVLAGGYAYVAAGSAGLIVIDVSNPAAPVQVGAVDTAGDARGVALAGTHAYVADAWMGIAIIGVANPAAPTAENTYGTPGDAWGIAIAGSHAYVADGGAGLRVLDITDPVHPSETGAYPAPGTALGVALSGAYAFVADDWTGGLQVIDVSDPANPSFAGEALTAGAPTDVVVAGTFAYVADAGAGLSVVNVANPGAPSVVGTCDTPGNAQGVALSGTHALIADYSKGLVVIDVSTPSTPAPLGAYADASGEVNDVSSDDQFVCVTDGAGMQVIDVSDPTAPTRISGAPTHEYAWGLTIAANFGYLADGCAGLAVIDLSSPLAPQRRGAASTGCASRDVVVQGDFAYVADDHQSLLAIDISVPDAPTLAGQWQDPEAPGYALGIAVSGSHAYLANANAGLEIIDVSNPASPSRVGNYHPDADVLDVAVVGQYACLANDWLGFQIISVADPAAPVWMASVDTVGGAQGVAVQGPYAFVAASDAGLQIVDISNPAAPALVGHFDTAGVARRVAVIGSRVYVADQDGGLVVLEVGTLRDFVWTNPAGGDFGDAANWSPVGGPPGPQDRAVFSLGSAYTVTFGADRVNERLLAEDGDVLLNLGGRSYSVLHDWDGTPSVALGDSRTPGSPPATARLTVRNGWVTAKELELGRQSGRAGVLTVAGGAQWDGLAHSVTVGAVDAGTVTVQEASLVQYQSGWLGYALDSSGTVNVRDPYSNWAVLGDFTIGREGTGVMMLDNAGRTDLGRCVLGELAPGQGTMTIRGFGLANLIGVNELNLVIGDLGQGALTMQQGAVLNNDGHARIAQNAGSVGHLVVEQAAEADILGSLVVGIAGGSGTVEVRDQDSLLSISGRGSDDPGFTDHVGLALGQNGGQGAMTVSSGGAVICNWIATSGAWGDGAVGSLLVDGDSALFQANYQLEVGRDAPGSVTVQNGGQLLVTQDNSDPVLLPGNRGLPFVGLRAEGHVLVTGSGAGGPSVLSSVAQLNVGIGAVGSATVSAGGQLVSHKATSPSGSSGIIGRDATGDGSVTVTGPGSQWTQDGLVDIGWLGQGALSVESGGHAASAAGAIGRQSGAVGVATVAGTDSTWDITGGLGIGGLMDTSGGSGTLHVNAGGVVAVGDAVQVWGAGQIVLDGGTLDAGAGGVVLEGSLSGSGTVLGSVQNQGGVVSPGASAGLLQVSGDYNQDATGVLDVEIGGLTPGSEFDRLAVGGTATLDGDMLVTLAGSYVPPPNSAFDVMTYAAHQGAFAAVSLPTSPASRRYRAEIGSTAVTIRVGRTGDTNCDGKVNFNDINYFVFALAGQEPAWRDYYVLKHEGALPPCPYLVNDTDGNNKVDFRDINPFIFLILTGP